MKMKSALPGMLAVLAGLIGVAGATGAQATPVKSPVSASASQAAGAYKGRTPDDGRIRMRLAGRRVSGLQGTVPAICLELGGSYDSRVGYELFRPPGTFTLGRTRKVKAMQPGALNGGANVTKSYTVTVRSAGKRLLKGRLKLSYVFLTFGFPDLTYLWSCSSSVRFTARKA